MQRKLLEERFQRGLHLLVELSKTGIPIAVEGLKDVEALRRLGLTGPIYTLAGYSIVTLADALAGHDQLLVLFDFDTRGEQLARQLTEQLQGRGVTLLRETRLKLKRAFSWQSRVIEGLKPLTEDAKATKL